ncbi:hypothetical protein ABFY57_00380 [Paenibacillus polymyxa]
MLCDTLKEIRCHKFVAAKGSEWYGVAEAWHTESSGRSPSGRMGVLAT